MMSIDRRVARVCVGVLVGVGAVLRFAQLGDAALFGDEIHAYRLAIQFEPLWLATHFTPAGGYAPYSLYNELLMATLGLNEWGMRFPSALAGIMMTAFCARLALRHLSPFSACALTAFLALSPYLVYAAREARTYTLLMLCFTFSAARCFAWLRGGGRRDLVLAALAAVATLLFHPGSAPSVACLGLLPIVVTIARGETRQRLPDLAAAAVATALSFAILIAPALPTILREVALFRDAASANLETFRGSMMLALGIPLDVPSWVWLALVAAGAARAWRIDHLATGFALATLGVQLVVLFRLQSIGFDVPWFFLRYSLQLLPIFALLCILAVAPPARWTTPALRVAAALGVLVAAGGYALYQGQHQRYALGNRASLNVHPLLLFVPAELPEDFRRAQLPAFYRDVLPGLEGGRLLEAPLILSFPLYSIYQREHDRDYAFGAWGGRVQKLFRRTPGQQLENAHFVGQLGTGYQAPARYLVLHKRVWDEIALVRSYFQGMSATALQFHGLDEVYNPTTLRHRFGPDPLVLPTDHPAAANLVYDDAWVAVYDLDPTAPATP